MALALKGVSSRVEGFGGIRWLLKGCIVLTVALKGIVKLFALMGLLSGFVVFLVWRRLRKEVFSVFFLRLIGVLRLPMKT